MSTLDDGHAPDVALGPLNDSFKWFLANVAFTSTPQEIKQYFSSFGTVNFVKLIYDIKLKKSRGYGFLYMYDAQGDAEIERFASSQQHRINLLGQARVLLQRHDQSRVLPMRNAPKSASGHPEESYQQPQQQGASSSYGVAPTYGEYAPPVHQQQQQQQQQSYGTYAPPPLHQQQPRQPQPYDPYAAPAVPSYMPQLQSQMPPVDMTSGHYDNIAPAAPGYDYSYPLTNYAPDPNTAYAPPVQDPYQSGPYGAPFQPSSLMPQPSPYPSYSEPPLMNHHYIPSQQQQQYIPPPPPPPQQRPSSMSTKIFLQNLPTDVTPKDVVQCLTKHSLNVRRCTMEYDSDPKASWCYAHIDVATSSDASRLLDLAQQSRLYYRSRLLQASVDLYPPSDGVHIPVGMGAPISTGPRPAPRGNPDSRSGPPPSQHHYRGGGRGGRSHAPNRDRRRDRPY